MTRGRKRHVILLNGPPGSGKDEFARALVNNPRRRIHHVRFKDPLIKMVSAIYTVDVDVIERMLLDQEEKMKPLDMFWGSSLRDVLIHTSEKVIKPNFGSDYFGRAMQDCVFDRRYLSNVFVASDLGFAEEINGLKHPDIVFHPLKLYRDGKNFDNDSRSYIDDEIFGVASERFDNNGSLESLENIAISYLDAIL